MLTHPKRKIIESALLVVVFVSILVFFVHSYYLEQRVSKQEALHYQLTILRQGVKMYNLVEKKYPKSLMRLATSSYTLPGSDNQLFYIQNFPIAKDGQLLDPFGNSYSYNAENGWVMSSSKGYSFW